MTLLDNGNVRNEAWKAETRKGFINNSRLAIDGCKDGNRFYCTDWIITTPTVKAIMTPTIITLEACWVRRITEVMTEIPNIAAINAAGAITWGISLVSQISVSILFFFRNDE